MVYHTEDLTVKMMTQQNNNLAQNINDDEFSSITQVELQVVEEINAPEQTASIISSFVTSCQARGDQPLGQWLDDEFRKYPQIWKNEEELLNTRRQIIRSTEAFNQSRDSLQQHMDKGRSRASWLAGEIEKNAAVSGSVHVGQYASLIDSALVDANENARKTITTLAGNINQNPNLDGLVAEQHHVDTFNIDATTKGSPYRARVVGSQELNSVDIEIVDGNGNVVCKYQSKYGADSNATNTQLNRGDYNDQQALVPEGQGADVVNSTEVIEADGVSSQPLSKEKAKELQKKAQQDAEARQYDWNDTNRIDIAKQIGKQAVLGACIAVGMQGTRILARRAWNRLNGRENPSTSEDLNDFFESSLRTGTQTAIQVAVSGAVVVAVKNGFLGAALRSTPAGLITNIVCVGIQNAKVLYKLGKGELTGEEALDAIGNTTITTTMAIAGATEGATLGAAIGTVFGPVGTAVGGFVGGVAGGIAGGQIGEIVYNAGKVVAKTAAKVIASVTENASHVIKSFSRGISNFASNLLSFW